MKCVRNDERIPGVIEARGEERNRKRMGEREGIGGSVVKKKLARVAIKEEERKRRVSVSSDDGCGN